MTDADCIAPNSCIDGSCGKKPVGATCGNDVECNSSFCAQGVCCATACTGTCKSCALSGSAGTCTNVPAGQDPLMQCADAGAMTCGLDGTCDGAGACRMYALGDDLRHRRRARRGPRPLAGRCDGTGTCQAGTLQSCSPYVCGATACLTTCATSADCARRLRLQRHDLRQEGRTALTCTAGAECASGYCEQGVCCNAACAGPACRAPDRARSGPARAIAAGTAPSPATQCAAAAASTCGTDGTCNGAGACRQFAAGTHLRRRDLHGLDAARRRGPATARAPAGPRTTSMCDPFVCGSSNACRIDCTTTHRLRRAQHLHEQQLRQEAARRDLRDRGRVQLGLLRAGGLLQHRLHRDLQVVRARRQRRGPARNVAGRPGPDARHPVHRRRRHELRQRRHLRRHRRLPHVRERHVVRGRRPAPARPTRRRAPATAPAPARRRRARRATPTAATRR